MTDIQTLYKKVAAYGPVSATLAKLIRPTIQADEGKVLVWGDYASIEARTNPWLADSPQAEHQVLRYYREGIDLYIENAKAIFGVDSIDPETADGERMRQGGKIAVLSLGFLGAVGALKAMARSYGMRLSDTEAAMIVLGWRARNTWAKQFGYAAWDAFQNVIDNPGLEIKVGKLVYTFDPAMLSGSVLCWLPSGRPLVYPHVRKGFQEDKDSGEETYQVTYAHRYGRARMWAGKCIQGPTQAVAADLLRRALVKLDSYDITVAHTHDEIVAEVPEDKADYWAAILNEIMLDLPNWAKGLPLAVDIKSDFYYHK